VFVAFLCFLQTFFWRQGFGWTPNLKAIPAPRYSGDVAPADSFFIGETDDPNAVIESYEAEAAVTKGDPVYLSFDDKVSPAAAAQDCIGMAVKTVALGSQCPVLTAGRVKVKAGAAITVSKAVYGADSSKRVLMLSDQAVDEGKN
jgi:hypothetical protein